MFNCIRCAVSIFYIYIFAEPKKAYIFCCCAESFPVTDVWITSLDPLDFLPKISKSQEKVSVSKRERHTEGYDP